MARPRRAHASSFRRLDAVCPTCRSAARVRCSHSPPESAVCEQLVCSSRLRCRPSGCRILCISMPPPILFPHGCPFARDGRGSRALDKLRADCGVLCTVLPRVAGPGQKLNALIGRCHLHAADLAARLASWISANMRLSWPIGTGGMRPLRRISSYAWIIAEAEHGRSRRIFQPKPAAEK